MMPFPSLLRIRGWHSSLRGVSSASCCPEVERVDCFGTITLFNSFSDSAVWAKDSVNRVSMIHMRKKLLSWAFVLRSIALSIALTVNKCTLLVYNDGKKE